MTSTALNALDELYLHMDRPEEAWSVHVEVRVAGRVDADRLRAAALAAADRHPMARAQLAPSRVTDVRYRWDIADALDEVDLEEVGAGELDDARERLLARTPPLDRPGPFALLLAHDADAGDVIVLNLHHAAGDGLSAVRLLRSIAHAYAGEDDPEPAVDALEVRDVAKLAAPSIKERLTRGRAALDYLTRGAAAPTRLSPDGDRDRDGYGFAFAVFERDEVDHLLGLRSGGATVNDVLLGALAVTARRWNAEHGDEAGTVYLMMPMNLRPAAWKHDIVGNFASYVSVKLGADDHQDLRTAIAAAAAGTRRIKDDGVAGLMVDLVGAPTLVPAVLRKRVPDLMPLSGNVVVDTAVLSNLGRVADVPTFGEAGAVKELWFSPPGRMPLGASFGVATLDGRLFVSLRHRHAQFDADAARRFLALLEDTCAGG